VIDGVEMYSVCWGNMNETVKRTLRMAVSSMLIAAGLLAADAIRIGTHALGESQQEWLSHDPHVLDDLISTCAGKSRRNYKEWCKYLADLRDGNVGEIHDRGGNRVYTYTYTNGKLSKIEISTPDSVERPTGYDQPNMQAELQLVIDKYGPPTSANIVAYQNGYGAHWDCFEDTWIMTDGAQIVAWESIIEQDHIHYFTVIFISKEYAENEKRQQSNRPNPY
jgi:hypothetical protein